MKKCIMVIVALLFSMTTLTASAATFSQADLTGTWVMHQLRTGSTSRWFYGTFTVDSSGNAIGTNCNSTGNTNCPTTAGQTVWTINSSGVITESGSLADFNVNMTMTSNKNFIAGTSGSTGGTDAALRIMQKVVPGTTYSPSDLYNKSFVTHQLRTGYQNGTYSKAPQWEIDTFTTDGSGIISAVNWTTPSASGTSPSPGTMSVDSSGNMIGMNFNGFLSDDKKTIVATVTETDSNGSSYQLWVMQITGQTYTAGPFPAGITTQYMVAEVDFTNSPDFMNNPYAFWVAQTQTVTSGGVYTYSNATSSTNDFTPDSGGTASITSSGTVTTTEDSTYNGQMSDDGTFSVGTATSTDLTDPYSDNLYMLIVHTVTSVNTNNIYGSFSGGGIWKWNGSSWSQVTPNNPQLMVTSGATLYGSFSGGGIWKWNGSSWSQVTPNNPLQMVILGSNLYGSFTGGGIWQWNGTTWSQVTPNTPLSMVTLGSNLYGTFTGGGIWKWDGTTWSQVTPNNPNLMVATSTILYGSFAGGGIWQWDGSSWTQATPNNPQLLVASGGNLYGSFAGGGVWEWDGTNWTQTTPNNPQQMVASNSNLYGSFAGGGIWQWDGSTWTQLTPNNPASMVLGN